MSIFTILVNLCQSIALLVALAFIYSLLSPALKRLPEQGRNATQGLIFGLFGSLSLLTGTQIFPGFILDGRTIILAMAGYIGGPISGIIAAVVVAIVRLLLGGGGTLTAIMVGITSAAFGILFYWYEKRKQIRLDGRWFLVLGGCIVVARVVWAYLLGGSQGSAFVEQTVVPIVIAFPLGTWLFGTLLRNQESQHEIVETLAVERTMLRTLIDQIPDYIFIKDKTGRFLLSNIAHARAAKAQTAQALVGKTANYFFPSEFAEQYHQDDQRVLAGETILTEERRTVNAEGNPIWVTTTKVPMRSATGEIIGIVGVSRDVTQRKEISDAIAQLAVKYRQIIDTATEGIWMIDLQGETTFVNPRMATMLGYSAEEMVGRPLIEYVDAAALDAAARSLERRQEGVAEEHDFMFRKKDGSAVWAIVSTTPITDDNNEYAGTMAMITDITDRKLAEEQALELTAERQRVQVLKRFINDMSHDFRTPLSVMQTSLFLLRKTATDQQKPRLDKLDAQVTRLSELFEEILDAYTMDNEEQVRLVPCSLNPMIQQIIEKRRPAAEHNLQTLQFLPAQDMPLISIDQWSIERAIGHLIRNAIQFTPEHGTITVQTYIEGGQAVIMVQDTGAGIQPDALPHIFEHFYREDSARSTQTGGNGLGLAITRKIVEAHRGTITVESTPGQGSTFRLFLPIREASPSTP